MPRRILGPCSVKSCPNRADCPDHKRTRQQRGYDARHDALGRHYQARMDAGERFTCWRCGTRLGTIRGVDWVLGHDDIDRRVHRGPECVPCNASTASRPR